MDNFSGILTINQEGEIQNFNSQAEKLFGYNELEVRGQNIKTLISKPYQKDLDRYLENGFVAENSQDRGQNIEVVGLRKDRTLFSLEFCLQTVHLNEKPVRVAVVRDLTKYQRETEEKESIINQNNLILKAAREGIFGMDMEGNITFVNPAVEFLLGYSTEELIGQPQHLMIRHSKPDGTPYPKEESPIYTAIKDGRIHREAKEVFWRKDGTSIPAEYVCAPIRKDEKLLGAVVIFSDITDLKLSEAKNFIAISQVSQAKEEAEIAKATADKANKAKSAFLANMSHEIRTPLNAVLGYSQILQRNSFLDPKQKKAVKAIETSGTHLLELINDILDISKIEGGQVELNPTDFDLLALINGLGEMFRVRAEVKGINFRVEGLEGDPILVHGDEGKIRQILVNLLGNAVKFTEQGEVVIKLEKAKDNEFRFVVRDTGKGISPNEQIRIFDPFKQAEEGLSKGGTGLGLAISWELTDLMEGQLSLESQVGKGSKFSFTLKLDPATKPVLPRSKRDQQVKKLTENSRVKAMVVDDMEVNRELLSDVLQTVGIDVLKVENGKEAVDQAGSFEPDIIFMDIRMPVMNGEEAIREIFKRYGKGRYKIVAVTASAMGDEISKYESLGCDDSIAKPFRIATVYNCIKSLLGVEYVYEKDVRTDQDGNETQDEAPIPATNLSEVRVPAKRFLNLKNAIDKKNISRFEKELAKLCKEDNAKILEDNLAPLLESNDFEGMLDILEQVLVVGTLHD